MSVNGAENIACWCLRVVTCYDMPISTDILHSRLSYDFKLRLYRPKCWFFYVSLSATVQSVPQCSNIIRTVIFRQKTTNVKAF